MKGMYAKCIHACLYDCLSFSQYKSMGAIGHQGMVHMDPRGLVGSTYSGPLHIMRAILISGAWPFKFGPQGLDRHDLCRGPLDITTCKDSGIFVRGGGGGGPGQSDKK